MSSEGSIEQAWSSSLKTGLSSVSQNIHCDADVLSSLDLYSMRERTNAWLHDDPAPSSTNGPFSMSLPHSTSSYNSKNQYCRPSTELLGPEGDILSSYCQVQSQPNITTVQSSDLGANNIVLPHTPVVQIMIPLTLFTDISNNSTQQWNIVIAMHDTATMLVWKLSRNLYRDSNEMETWYDPSATCAGLTSNIDIRSMRRVENKPGK